MTARPLIALALTGLIAAGCAQSVANTENALSQAGFQMQSADTPRRQAALLSLQPHKFSMQIRNAKAIWVYADPTICHCLYLGDQFAYDNYMAAKRLKQEMNYEQMVRMSNANNAMPYPFQWEDWGPGTPYYQ